MFLDKRINFKVCKNGTLQMTGVKLDNHVSQCIEKFWSLVKDYPSIYDFKKKDDSSLECMIIPSMRNIDFDL